MLVNPSAFTLETLRKNKKTGHMIHRPYYYFLRYSNACFAVTHIILSPSKQAENY